MTPAQLRAFSAVVRLGSVHGAATELGMSDAGVSMHIAQLRKELDDPLFTRTATGLSFTPGGLRLASRAVEILGLQQQTAIEVTEAARGRRLLRIAASTTFAEHAAPGVIELFASRADDLSVELSVHPTSRFQDLIQSRAVDIALGPRVDMDTGRLVVRPFLNYQIVVVTSADYPLAGDTPTPAQHSRGASTDFSKRRGGTRGDPARGRGDVGARLRGFQTPAGRPPCPAERSPPPGRW